MKAFDEAFLNKLDRLKLYNRKAIQGGMGGNRKSKAKGSSIEFSDFREYTPGDDYRSIDWNAYARFQRLFIKLYMEERETNVTIMVDTSASMGSINPEKGIAAKRLAAIFAYVALANYDRVGMGAIDDRLTDHLPYFSGKVGFSRVLTFLEDLEFKGETGLTKAITSYSPLEGKRGITILISDLFSRDGYGDALKWLKYKRQELVVLHTLSPEELDPPWTGPIRLVDCESEQEVQVEMTYRALGLYKRSLESFLNKVKAFCSDMDISYTLLNSHMSMDDLVFGSLLKAGILA
ncbi:MAG TPA: DUF58 domain-containing protein [Bacillota bacterium]|nr:DUF58 domain-containing protein [Bacillota bacterium]